MRLPRRVASILLITSTLPAQYFLSAGSETRRTTSTTWVGLSGQQSVSIEYGQPKWRADHEGFMQQRSAGPLLLGKGAFTTLRANVDLAFGAQKLARGRWYVAAWRDAQQEWSLALFAADRVDAIGRGATVILSTEPDVRVPVRFTREEESVELFEVTLTDSRRTPHNLNLAMAWGPYRLRTEVTASFDDRKPEGTPEFALTAEGKGTRTGSGLIYEQLRAGTGAHPQPGDKARVQYTGWLTDGSMFDNSLVRGKSEGLLMEWVVKGFAEGLQLMQPGATFRLTIPPELAYGAAGNNRVPPNATLVFTVTLLGIDKQ